MMKKLLIKSTQPLVCLSFVFAFYSCNKSPEFYSFDDFAKIKKIDAHFHYNVTDPTFLFYADSLNFKIVTPNTRTIHDEQFYAAKTLKKDYPDKLSFFGTFDPDTWNEPDYAENTIKRIELVMDVGACGIKIWKNIGMVIQDSTGKYITIDDPVFEPVFDYMEKNNITVLAHLGEPKDCWQPLEEMKVKSNKDYYTNHPEYHMYLHPEAPSYEEQLAARDNVINKHPELNFIGAHLASLEWSVDELAKWLDKYPNCTVDMAARINHLHYQASVDREKVRNFVIKYQDRLLYATDRSVSPSNTDIESLKKSTLDKWHQEWVFLATDSVFRSKNIFDREVMGLKLPKEVIDDIYYNNASYLFNL